MSRPSWIPAWSSPGPCRMSPSLELDPVGFAGHHEYSVKLRADNWVSGQKVAIDVHGSEGLKARPNGFTNCQLVHSDLANSLDVLLKSPNRPCEFHMVLNAAPPTGGFKDEHFVCGPDVPSPPPLPYPPHPAPPPSPLPSPPPLPSLPPSPPSPLPPPSPPPPPPPSPPSPLPPPSSPPPPSPPPPSLPPPLSPPPSPSPPWSWPGYRTRIEEYREEAHLEASNVAGVPETNFFVASIGVDDGFGGAIVLGAFALLVALVVVAYYAIFRKDEKKRRKDKSRKKHKRSKGKDSKRICVAEFDEDEGPSEGMAYEEGLHAEEGHDGEDVLVLNGRVKDMERIPLTSPIVNEEAMMSRDSSEPLAILPRAKKEKMFSPSPSKAESKLNEVLQRERTRMD